MTRKDEITRSRHAPCAPLGLTLLLLLACGQDEGTAGSAAASRDRDHEEAQDAGLVTLTEGAHRNAGIRVTIVGLPTPSSSGVSVPGRVAFDPAGVVVISPRSSGRLERLTVVEGDEVAAGTTVAYILSRDFLTAQGDYIQAVRRAVALHETPDADGARAVAEAARHRLVLLGAPESLATSLADGGAPQDLLPVTTVFTGSIVEAHARVGEAVEAGTPIYTLADLSVLDVIAAVPEHLLRWVDRGQIGQVRLTAYPDLTLVGRVVRVGAVVDRETRTVDVVVRVPNERGVLRDGMFATVTLLRDDAPGGAASSVITLPEAAVLWDGPSRYVFVQVGERSYERRLVSVGPPDEASPQLLRILEGLAVGETVVTDGAFTLKAELSKASFGEQH